MKSVLPFFHPTEVILIDDDVSILKEWNIKLRNLSVISKPFENPFELIHQLQNEYPEISILQNPAFVEVFGNITRENKVVEYYLLDAMGSFLFLSETGKSNVLFVFNEETLEFQEDMIPESDRNTDLAQEIYNHQKAICFYPFKASEKYDPIDWKKYVYPLSKLDGKSTCFWAYVESLSSRQSDQIASFSGYRESSE